MLYLLSKQNVIKKNPFNDYYEYQNVINPYVISNLLQEEKIAKSIFQYLRSINTNIKKVDIEKISKVIKSVIKPIYFDDNQENKEAQAIVKKIKKLGSFLNRSFWDYSMKMNLSCFSIKPQFPNPLFLKERV